VAELARQKTRGGWMMHKQIEGQLISKGKSYGIVVSRFNDFISRRLLDGACDTLLRHGAKETEIEVIWTPGSFEIPGVINRLANSKKYDALIALGAVIRGGTPHFDYIAGQAARGVAQMSLTHSMPVVFGIITADTIEQAIERAGTKAGNKGVQAALSAIEMVNLYSQI